MKEFANGIVVVSDGATNDGCPSDRVTLGVGDEWEHGYARLTPDEADDIAEALTDAAEAIRARSRVVEPRDQIGPCGLLQALFDDAAEMVLSALERSLAEEFK